MILDARPFTVLDGGLSTALERRGHDLAHPLWTARLLRDDPDALVTAHLDHLVAGAEVVITSSYQASVDGFVAAGASRHEATRLLERTTALARTAVDRHATATGTTPALVAASVGPYGAVLADGSEYRGRYDLTARELRRFHAERLAVLVASGPDLVAVETVPTAAEAATVVDVLTALAPDLPAWVSFTCGTDERTWGGDTIEDAARAVADAPQVVALGVNCTAPRLVGPLLGRLRAVTDRALVAYPNHGRTWDGAHDRWTGAGADELVADRADAWVALGARLVGGCCGVGPEQIAALRARRDAAYS